MKLTNTKVIVFSPTGGSLKYAQALAEGVGLPLTVVNATTPKGRASAETKFGPEELVIVAVPVYGGHVAPVAKGFIEELRGDNTPVILVAVYGNRHYDETLGEMQEILETSGFVVEGACALIAEHSYSDIDHPIAAHRPTEEDLLEAKGFGVKVSDKLLANGFVAEKGFKPPFNENPLKQAPKSPIPRMPKTLPDSTNQWKDCILVCPTAAMSIRDGELVTSEEKCIFCMACVKAFPQVRYSDHPFLSAVREKLEKLPRRENEIWL